MDITEEIRLDFQTLNERFNSDKAGDLVATFQFILTDNKGTEESAYVVVADWGRLTTREGKLETPDVTVTMSSVNYLSIIRNEADPRRLALLGKIGAKGNRSLLIKFINGLEP